MDLKKHAAWFEKRLLERFLRYVKIDTTSKRSVTKIPSTPGQRVLAEELCRELASLGCEGASVTAHGVVFSRLPAPSAGKNAPAVALIAHLDTSEEAPGKNVRPQVHEKYDGKPIRLKNKVVLDPDGCPELKAFIGGTVITSAGDTLLGADDKAGLAAIVTAAEFLLRHPEIKRGPVEIVFTPDEETGRGTDHFPWDKIKAKAAVTADGSGDGVVETECFEAYRVDIDIRGVSYHPGEARGKLVNAVEIAAELVGQVPKSESPQATDGRFGYYAPTRIEGAIERASVEYIIRDFDDAACRARVSALRSLAVALGRLHPGARLAVKAVKQYSNMKPWIARSGGRVVAILKEAVRRSGVEPREESIRGGTDGARLSERGLPCPNLFSGGFNYHSRSEWAALPAMVRSAQALVHFTELWGAGSGLKKKSRKGSQISRSEASSEPGKRKDNGKKCMLKIT